MIVLVLLLSVGETAWHTRGPDNEILPFHVVVEQFRCPGVHRRGVHSRLDKTLGSPVDKVFRGTVAEAQITPPTAGPYQMEGAVGTLSFGGRLMKRSADIDVFCQQRGVSYC